MQLKKGLLFSLWTVFCITTPGYAALNDLAVFAPEVDNWMSVQQQTDVANYLTTSERLPDAQVYNYAKQSELVEWMNKRLSDGKSDVLLILDLAPDQVFNDEDNSLAEQWIENGNMLLWSGSEPFRSSVDAGGTIIDLAADGANDGANKVLNIKGESLCTGYASIPQKYTSVAIDTSDSYDYLPSLNLNYTGSNMRSLRYVDILTEAENVVTWDDAPNMVIDEMFAENDDAMDTTHVYESDAIVLTMRKTESDRKGDGGQYAQFYCYRGLVDGVDSNVYRKPVLYEFLQNWMAKAVNLIWVATGATGGDGSEASPYGTIQEGINAAEAFSRDRVMVKPGTYNETLVMKQSVKLISAGDDERGNVVGYLDDLLFELDPPESYTYNTFSQVKGKKALTRAENTVIDGTGLPATHPMIDIPKWATMGTWVDGFSIRNMPQVDHTMCGHAHTIQTRGSSAIIIDNILFNNGSGGLGSHSMFNQENICLNDDFRYSNVKYNAHPALINNIVGASNGPNLGNNHYSYSIMYHNECYLSGYFGGNNDIPMVVHEAPGIGNQHGAHSYIYQNVIYDSAWTGIGAKRGTNNNTATDWKYYIDRPTRPFVKDNYVFNSGKGDVLGPFGAGIGGSNTGGPDAFYSGDILYHVIDHNFILNARDATIGVRYREDEDGDGTTVDRQSTGYAIISNNTGTQSEKAGIAIDGALHIAEITHNEMTNNVWAGIGINDGAGVGNIVNNFVYENEMAGIGMTAGARVAAILNNTIVRNGLAGIGHDGFNDDESANKVVVGEESGNTIEWNLASGIGMQHAEVSLMANNEIKNNALPGLTVMTDSDIGDKETGGMWDNHLQANGRGDLHGSATYTAGMVVAGVGSTAFMYGNIIEESGMVNVEIGEGAEVAMHDTTIRSNHLEGPNVHIFGEATISNCTFEDAVTAGLVAGEGAVLSLEDTIVRNNGTVGVSIAGGTVASFSGNTISDNQAAGISSLFLGNDLHIEKSSIQGNGTPGIVLEDLEYNVTISDSFIGGNGMGGIRINNSRELDILDTVIHNYNDGVVVHDDTPEQASVIRLSNCDMDHPESGVRMWGGASVTIKDSLLRGMEFHDVGQLTVTGSMLKSWNIGILVDGGDWANIIDNNLKARWPLKLEGTSANVINNVTGTDSDGYIVHNSIVNFYHNTMYGGESAVKQAGILANYGSTVYAYNNIIIGAQSGIRLIGGSELSADNNLFWQCRREFFAWSPGDGIFHLGDNNLIDVDPELVDPVNGDYHLSATSPCIDAGDSDIEVFSDMDGDSRPQDAGPDIGADEVGSLDPGGGDLAAIYYVDAGSGNDGNSGTSEDDAWSSIRPVNQMITNDLLNGGDQVLFKRGETFRYYGLMIHGISGEENYPIIFGSYGSEALPLPKIDGVRPVAWVHEVGDVYYGTTWNDREPNLIQYKEVSVPPISTLRFDLDLPATLQENGVLLQTDGVYTSLWVTSTTGRTVSGITRYDLLAVDKPVYFRYVDGSGREVQWPTSIGFPQALQGGDARAGLTKDGDWYWDDIAKHIVLYSGQDPGTISKVNILNDGIRIDHSQFITVQDLMVQHFNKQGIVLYNSSDIMVQGNKVYGCGKTGIQIWASGNTIQNNVIDSNSGGISLYAPPGNDTVNNSIQNNTISNCRGACIGLSSDPGTFATISGNHIYGNTITGANSMSYDGAGVYTFYAGENSIDSNTISGCGSIYLRSAGIMIDWGGGPLTITGNIIEYNSNGGIQVSGYGHLVSNNSLTNNGIATMDRPQIGFFNGGVKASNITVTGNIMHADAGYHFITAENGSDSGHTINYNSYSGQSTEQFRWPPVTQWMDFGTWQSETEHDAESSFNNL